MHQEFIASRNVYLDRDDDGVARQLVHAHAPVGSNARSAQLVAAEYLGHFGDLLGFEPRQLASLGLAPARAPEEAPVEYRFLAEKHQFDTTTVAYNQTDFGLPVWQAGVAVQMKDNPFRVISSQSTIHPNLDVKRPTAAAAKRAESLSEEELPSLLGLERRTKNAGAWERSSLKIEGRSLAIYRYDSRRRLAVPPAEPEPDVPREARLEERNGFAPLPPTLPLPPVAGGIEDGRDYVCAKVEFALASRSSGLLHWVALIEVESLSVLYLRAFVDHVSGLVFERDPITANGGPGPGASSALLNPVRVAAVLPGLAAPAGGTQSLQGDNVRLSDVETPTIGAPTEPVGTNFDFDARTDNFAAVNAYYHCDRFFRLLDGMGFTQPGYFGGTTFPSAVDHRGSIGTSTGIEVNAHCVGTAGGAGIQRTTFALAETGNTGSPIGLSTDYRVVLHELGGHGVLYNHVSSANFRFAHSAGDSFAAILNDPATQAADRFQTFPWVFNPINRRHDRTPAAGWGWAGNIALNPFLSPDPGGYNNEQILSTTHFRIYRSIGGDSTDVPTQRFAARMMAYLMLRAIASLTPATNPANASAWATALITADLGDWISENITGGAYRKVIRWAFEKQGLYQPAGTATPNNNIGAPPAVDLYIDDGRAGEYQYQPVFWNCQSIWNRRASDGGATHEEPVTGKTNYAYVKIKNRGTQPATNVTVRAYHANPAAGLSYPIDWTAMTTAQLAAPNVPANNAAEITVGPFAWVPTHVGHECMFMIVAGTGDPSNVDTIPAGDSMPEWRLVPNDNNIGQRNVFPVSGGGTSGLVSSFERVQLELKNPTAKPARMEVRGVLPDVLSRRDWRIEFTSRGGGAFLLGPGESREITVRLAPGAEFGPADVAGAEDRTIHLYGYADGSLIGGMSYELDPSLRPEPGDPQGEHCNLVADELLRCVDLPRERVRGVRIRKITVDIELDGEWMH